MGASGRGGRQQRKFRTAPTEANVNMNLRPCLVHIPTGDVVRSYTQLSRIVKKLGWKVFIDVSGNVWSSWFLPEGGEPCYLQMVFLPHPHISTATLHQLSIVVQAFGSNTFNISYAPLKKFREADLYGDVHKPVLRQKANGREVITILHFSRILASYGWREEADNQFVKRDITDKSPMDLITVMKIPAVDNIQQLSTLDLEYITMVTENIFYLQSPNRNQPPRLARLHQEAKQQIDSSSKVPTSSSSSEYTYDPTVNYSPTPHDRQPSLSVVELVYEPIVTLAIPDKAPNGVFKTIGGESFQHVATPAPFHSSFLRTLQSSSEFAGNIVTHAADENRVLLPGGAAAMNDTPQAYSERKLSYTDVVKADPPKPAPKPTQVAADNASVDGSAGPTRVDFSSRPVPGLNDYKLQ
ncbi:hypothetical protein R1flu_023220 [Riccia fluitans]|uniref:Mating-type protein MAT1-1-1 n=1 Tax=Riccia fluitans TaxID=41844 RepID=A0ABD1XRF3_9MARC